MNRILASAMCMTVLSACSTSLDTHPVSLQQDRIDGVPYALPVLQLETKVTHRLTKCEIVTRDSPRYDPSFGPSNANLVVEFKSTVENKPTYPAAEYFVLDYSALGSVMKTSSFKVTYHDNRMLKSFNVAAQDKSIDVAIETIKAGVAIAGLVTGVPVTSGDAITPEMPHFACPTATVVSGTRAADGSPQYEQASLVELRSQIAAQRKSAVESLASANTKLAALNARAAQGTLSEKDKEEVTMLTGQGKELAQKIAGFDKQIAEFDKTLAYSETLRWQPARGSEGSSTPSRVFPFEEVDKDDATRGAARKRWVAGLFNEQKSPTFPFDFGPLDPGPCDPEDDGCEVDAPGRRIARALSLTFSLTPDHVVISPDAARAIGTRLGLSNRRSVAPAQRDHVRGVVTRQPVPGQFLICRGYDIPCTPSEESKLLDERVSVPQLGAYMVLPYSNGVGQDNVLNAEFAQTGEPTMIEYKENSAVALEAAKGLATSANSVNTFLQDLQATRLADAERVANEPLEQVERQYALLEQEKKLADLREQISPTDPLTILQSRASILEQEKKVAELQAMVSPQPDAHQDEIDRLTKELELLTLQVQIAEQGAKLGGG